MIPHILIIDADRAAACVTCFLIARVLPHATWSVAHDAARGAQRMRDQQPTLVVIDPSPRHHDDEKLIREIKHRRPDTYILVLTSVPSHALRRRMRALGVDDYLDKAAAPATLAAALRAAVAETGGAQREAGG